MSDEAVLRSTLTADSKYQTVIYTSLVSSGPTIQKQTQNIEQIFNGCSPKVEFKVVDLTLLPQVS